MLYARMHTIGNFCQVELGSAAAEPIKDDHNRLAAGLEDTHFGMLPFWECVKIVSSE